VAREVLFVLHDKPDHQFTHLDFCEALSKRLSSQHIALGGFLKLIPDPSSQKDGMDQQSAAEAFKPRISHRSVKLAQKKRDTTVPIHESLFYDAAVQESKRQERLREKEEAEMAHCTFNPFVEPAAAARNSTMNSSTTSESRSSSATKKRPSSAMASQRRS
jgi:hypothetical protein